MHNEPSWLERNVNAVNRNECGRTLDEKQRDATVFIWNWILKRSHLHSYIATQSLRSIQSGKHVLVLKKRPQMQVRDRPPVMKKSGYAQMLLKRSKDLVM